MEKQDVEKVIRFWKAYEPDLMEKGYLPVKLTDPKAFYKFLNAKEEQYFVSRVSGNEFIKSFLNGRLYKQKDNHYLIPRPGTNEEVLVRMNESPFRFYIYSISAGGSKPAGLYSEINHTPYSTATNWLRKEMYKRFKSEYIKETYHAALYEWADMMNLRKEQRHSGEQTPADNLKTAMGEFLGKKGTLHLLTEENMASLNHILNKVKSIHLTGVQKEERKVNFGEHRLIVSAERGKAFVQADGSNIYSTDIEVTRTVRHEPKNSNHQTISRMI